MTASVAHIAKAASEPLPSGRSTGGSAAVFDASLALEQADILLRQTDQYAQWQRLRQNNARQARQLAETVLKRESLLQDHAAGKSINWQQFDHLTSQARLAGINLPTAHELQSQQPSPDTPDLAPPGTATAPPLSPPGSPINEDNLLILSAVCPEIGVKQEIVAYGDQKSTLLPLGGIAQALGFTFKVDAQQGVASGWIISEDRTFSLDAAKKKIKIEGKTADWNEGQIFVGEDDIYVDSQLLSRWFPVDIVVSTGEMSAKLTPREQLPLQAQYERERKRKGLSEKEDTSLKYTPKQAPYELYSFPVMDVSLTSGIEKNGQESNMFRINHALVAEGDLAHASAKAFFSGDEEEPLDNARITLEKMDKESTMLGPMRASKIAAGDVSPVALPILGNRSVERGVFVANGDVQRNRDFDTTRFEGNAQPGWDVELYQNGNLINSVRVGSDGRYVFEDIPVYFGANAFQLLAHGPQGQRRMVETKNINVGSGMLKAGGFEYNLSATQRKNTVLGLDQEETSAGEGERLVGTFAYGVTDHLSATAGLSRVEFDDTLHNYLQAGLNGSLASLYGEINTITDSAGGSGHSIQGQTAWGSVNLRAKHEIFSDFVDENNPDRILKERTSFGVNGSFSEFTFLPTLSYTLSRENTTYEDSETGRTSARLSSAIKGIHLSNVLHWNDGETGEGTSAPVDGEFQASGTIGRGRITAGVGYDLGEASGITDYKLSGHWPIAQGISAGASVIREVDDDLQEDLTTARASLDFDTGQYILSPSLLYDSEGNFGAFLGLSFSLGKDPVSEEIVVKSEKRSGRGATTAFVYHDANNNKVFDQDDTPLPEVRVVARQLRRNVRTNDQGVAQFTGLAASEPTDVEIDPDSLKDPHWQPAVPGVAVLPRSGSVHSIDFPVVSTGEIDGMVYVANREGVKEPLANVQLELLDKQGKQVQKTVSEYDGFYLFEKVFPGTYTLQASSTDPRLKESVDEWQKQIVIDNDGTIARGNDIILAPPEYRNRDKAPADRPAPSAPGSSDTRQGMGHEALAAVKPSAPPSAKQTTTLSIVPLTLAASTFAAQTGTGNAAPNGKAGIARRETETRAAIPSPVPQPASKAEQPPAVPTKNGTTGTYAVHLASYKSMEAARRGMQILAQKLADIVGAEDLRVTKVDLGEEKGIYYRVTCGDFSVKNEADRLAARMRPRTGSALSLPVNYSTREQQPIATLPANRMPTGYNPKLIAQKYANMQRNKI